MAIVIPKQNKGGSFSRILMIVVILGILGMAAYYLFFAPTPAFDYIAPSALQETAELSRFDMDPDSVLNSTEFRSLRKINGLPTGGAFGRTNPFLSL